MEEKQTQVEQSNIYKYNSKQNSSLFIFYCLTSASLFLSCCQIMLEGAEALVSCRAHTDVIEGRGDNTARKPKRPRYRTRLCDPGPGPARGGRGPSPAASILWSLYRLGFGGLLFIVIISDRFFFCFCFAFSF